jgi:hypothetical protein
MSAAASTIKVGNGMQRIVEALRNLGAEVKGISQGTAGTATIVSGQTSIVVTHGFGKTPTADDITVTPTNAMGSATKFFFDTLTATTFTIRVNADPTGAGATFAWKCFEL